MIKKILNKKMYLFGITILRIWLASCLPIWALGDAIYDDALGVTLAENILQGTWLGSYNYLTLQKGVSFPIFLAVINRIGLSYNMAVILMWVVSALIFCHVFKGILSEKSRTILYTVILFNPITFDVHVVQRVYRSSLALPIMLLLLGFYLWIYFDWLYRKKLSWKIAGITGVFLAFFLNLRDDGIFLYPFIVVISIIIVGIAWKRRKYMGRAILTMLLPFGILTGINMAISAINYSHYGVFFTTEPSHSAFREFRDLLYAVKSKKDIPCVSVTREKLKRLYEVSPTLKTLSPELESAMDFWAICDRTPNDLEVEDGWIRWALRDGMNRGGVYVDAVTADETYKRIVKELQTAIEEGNLETQKLLPVDVLPVWKAEYIKPLITTVKKAFNLVCNYEDVSPESYEGTGDEKQLRTFEIITNEKAIYPTKKNIVINGWLALNKKNTNLFLKDKISQNQYHLEWANSEDVSNYLIDKKQFHNKHMCRFFGKIPTEMLDQSDDRWSLVAKDDIYELEIPINLETQIIENSNYMLCLDEFSCEEVVDPYRFFVEKRVDMIKCITKFLIMIMKVVAIVGTISFGVLTVFVIRDLKRDKLLNLWLISLACCLTFTVLAIAESLLQITAFDALISLYLAPGYVLMMLFFIIPILAIGDLKLKRNDE